MNQEEAKIIKFSNPHTPEQEPENPFQKLKDLQNNTVNTILNKFQERSETRGTEKET